MSENNVNPASQGLRYSTEQFDKNVLYIASGALGVSFAFIKDIVPDLATAVDKQFLMYSWYTFSVVIFIGLVSHFVSMLANRSAILNAKLDDDKYNKQIEKWNVWIRAINLLSIIGILLGAIMMVMFINKNI